MSIFNLQDMNVCKMKDSIENHLKEYYQDKYMSEL